MPGAQAHLLIVLPMPDPMPSADTESMQPPHREVRPITDRGLMVSLALAVTGLRWWTFHHAGSPLPYFDQWLAEFNNLFLVTTLSDPSWGIWFIPHNEHLLVSQKLVSMFGFLLNGYWDVKFLAWASGLLRGFEAVLVWRLLTREATPRQHAWIWWLCVAAFGVPWSVFNALNGMQISFYFAEVAMVLSLLTVQRWSGAWSGCLLVGLMIAGLGSMGSALAIPPATLALSWLQRRPRRGFVVAWIITLALGVAYVVHAGGGGSGSGFTQTVTGAAHFFLMLLAWPLSSPAWGLGVLIGAGGLLLLARAHRVSPLVAAGFALGVFAAGNAAMLAVNRTVADFHPRHWDTLIWLMLGTIIILAEIIRQNQTNLPRRLAGGVLILLLGFTMSSRFITISWPALHAGHGSRDAVVQHYREALLSGSYRDESDAVNEQLTARDYTFYDDPMGQFSIHPLVAVNIAASPLPALGLLSPEILPSRQPSVMSEITRGMMSQGNWITLAGLTGFAWCQWRSRRGLATSGAEQPPNQ